MKNSIKIFTGCLLFAFFTFSCKNEKSKVLYEPAPGPYTKIVISGKPNARIIVPGDPTFLEEYAASELQKYFSKMSHVSVQFMNVECYIWINLHQIVFKLCHLIYMSS